MSTNQVVNAGSGDAAAKQSKAVASPLLVLSVSVIGLSFAAPLVRLSTASALVIATWRMGLSLCVVAIALAFTGQWREFKTLDRHEFGVAALGGTLLAFHFWSWNASIGYTSVAASVTLVNLQPAIVAWISARWLGERASRSQWVGIVVAIIGAATIAFADVPGGIANVGAVLFGGTTVIANSNGAKTALLGDGLALIGAFTAACYYLIGRRVRQRLSLWSYVALVYGAAMVALLVLCVATKAPLTPQPSREIAIFAGLAVGPMLLGHTGMNWALGHLPAYVVNLTVLGEPVGATILAAIVPGIGEIPGVWTILGGILVLVGVVFAARK